ncbi:MAG: Ppx/GppA family phosphatase [Rhodospirillaceae bacterium]|nr:Ppx/GppA family phosphatase [Rhodospirillaceae bacterium]
MTDSTTNQAMAGNSITGHGRVAVVDIGSNSVRLVVYDAPARLPIPMFNEKAACALGLGMAASGRLNPVGIPKALDSVRRFVDLSRAMGVDKLEIVATAAVRDATDGPDFVAEIEKLTAHHVRVLSGEEEAKMAALGLLSGVPDADGIIGDLGGGSLDLVCLENGKFGKFETLPLGHLRLMERSDNNPEKAWNIVREEFSKLEWLKEVNGRTVFAAGGSWRSIARIFIEQIEHPLHVVDNFWIDPEVATPLLHILGGSVKHRFKKIVGVPEKRNETLSFAAIALAGLMEAATPARLKFSGFGMREGVMISSLPKDIQKQDPLISACTTMNERTGRFSITGDELLEWMAPLFPDETAPETRLRLAACLMSDVGWNEHPDYRAEQAFDRVLRVPYAGLRHTQRAVLALTAYVRYNGDPGDKLTAPVMRLLDDGQLQWVWLTGLALRLAHTICGSAPNILSTTRLRVDGNTLSLDVEGDDHHAMVSDAVQRRLKTLAKRMGLKSKVV